MRRRGVSAALSRQGGGASTLSEIERCAAVMVLAACLGCSGGEIGQANFAFASQPNGQGNGGRTEDGGENAPLVQGETIGIFELGTPSVPSFTLHGTLPLRKRVFPRSDGLSPFVVVDPEGAITPAQAEIVSRYPDNGDGADVVEVLARCARPASSQPGARLRYLVQYSPHAPGAFVPDGSVTSLLAHPASVYLRTKDCFGNRYGADLYADVRNPGGGLVRTLKNGEVAKQVVTHEMLEPLSPQSGPDGTLPHLMGAHAYFTRFANEPFFALDLRVHNGASGLDPNDPSDDALGKIYFRSLELCLPQGWTLLNAFGDPYFGAPYDDGGLRVWPIVQPIPGGAMHMMPAMSQFERRFLVEKSGSEQAGLSQLMEEGLGFSRPGEGSFGRDLDSWWNSRTACYFPQRQRLPWLDFIGNENLREADEAHLASRSAQVATGAPGAWPAESPGLGWAQPWGTPDGGMVSGEEIFLYDGVTTASAASAAGYRLHQLVHRMYTDRQCNALFDRNGLATSLPEWIHQGTHGPYVPIWWYNEPMLWASDPFGFDHAPLFQQAYVATNGLVPSYENALLAFDPIDEAHLVRYTHNAKALVWLGNDALAKDDLRTQAEGFRFAYHMYPQDDWGAVQPTGMLAARTYVDQHPGWGFPYGRGEAWGLDVMCAAYSTQDLDWRAATKPWFQLVADLVRDGQCTCNGVIQSSGLLNVFGGQYRCRQSIEAAITEHALVGLRESVFKGDDPARVAEVNEILKRSIYSMIGSLVWSDPMNGPQAMIAVAPIDGNQPPFCTWFPPDGTYGIPDTYQIWSSFAYAYELTNDETFLHKATQAAGGGNLLQDLVQFTLDPIQTNLSNQAALLALMQALHDNQH